MEKCTCWFLLISLLLQILPTISSLGTQHQSGFSNSKLRDAYTALQTWKSAITDDPFGILSTWVGPNVCSYSGVFCAAEPTDETNMDSQSGLVVVAGIDLNQANLQGSLVKELSLLSHISLIHLNSNRFTGNIPDTFKDFISLSELDLSNNQFSGLFPSVTLLLPQLIFLDLRFNNFSGTIPAQIFNMKLLDAIFINDNQFEGQIPQNLGNSRASVINLANNKLSGNIPSSFGYMGSSLKEVIFLNNQISGCMPQRIGLLSELKVLDVSFNSLMGSLPKSISCLNQIEVLNVANNKLSGVLSDQVCSLKSLLTLVVSNNLFSSISSECNKLIPRNLGLDLRLNCIIGLGSQKPPPECSPTPGGGPNCLNIPSLSSLICGLLGKKR